MMRQVLGEAFPLRVERERVRLEPGRVGTDLEYLEPGAAGLPPRWAEGAMRDFTKTTPGSPCL